MLWEEQIAGRRLEDEVTARLRVNEDMAAVLGRLQREDEQPVTRLRPRCVTRGTRTERGPFGADDGTRVIDVDAAADGRSVEAGRARHRVDVHGEQRCRCTTVKARGHLFSPSFENGGRAANEIRQSRIWEADLGGRLAEADVGLGGRRALRSDMPRLFGARGEKWLDAFARARGNQLGVQLPSAVSAGSAATQIGYGVCAAAARMMRGTSPGGVAAIVETPSSNRASECDAFIESLPEAERTCD